MRVTTVMRSYIKDMVAKKVADRLEKAEAADREQKTEDKKAFDAVKEYAKSLIPEMTKKVAAFAKKQGLTWFKNPWDWRGALTEEANFAFDVDIRDVDFEETCGHSDNKSPRRLKRRELSDEPNRIRRAIDRATNSIVFSLELGKAKKTELEELIASTEVEL